MSNFIFLLVLRPSILNSFMYFNMRHLFQIFQYIFKSKNVLVQFASRFILQSFELCNSTLQHFLNYIFELTLKDNKKIFFLSSRVQVR